MAVLDWVKNIFDTPSNIIIEIVKYNRMSSEDKKNYKTLNKFGNLIPYLYFWLVVQILIVVVVFM